jgi:hypothetical protein
MTELKLSPANRCKSGPGRRQDPRQRSLSGRLRGRGRSGLEQLAGPQDEAKSVRS